VRVISKPSLLKPEDLEGLPLQVIGIPWLNRSGLAAAMVGEEGNPQDLKDALESNLTGVVQEFMDALDPALPAVLASHATVHGAVYSSERSIMLGSDFVLPGSLVRDPRLDYVALGHIHVHQDLNKDGKPPVVYPARSSVSISAKLRNKKLTSPLTWKRARLTLNFTFCTAGVSSTVLFN
jgi:exonuclease SbcD